MKRPLDDWLEEAFAEYGRVEPVPGIEERAVADLRARLRRQERLAVWRRPAWLSAAALAILLLLVTMLQPAKPPAPQTARSDDQQLLIGIDRMLDREVPPALAPALVLTREIGSKK